MAQPAAAQPAAAQPAAAQPAAAPVALAQPPAPPPAARLLSAAADSRRFAARSHQLKMRSLSAWVVFDLGLATLLYGLFRSPSTGPLGRIGHFDAICWAGLLIMGGAAAVLRRTSRALAETRQGQARQARQASPARPAQRVERDV